MALLLATVARRGIIIGTQSARAWHHGHHGHHDGYASSMSSGGGMSAHSTAFLYGVGLGKNAGLRGYYDVMNECSNRPYLSSNVTGAIKNFTSLQQVNDCDSGYDQGWNKYCHIGLANHPVLKTFKYCFLPLTAEPPPMISTSHVLDLVISI